MRIRLLLTAGGLLAICTAGLLLKSNMVSPATASIPFMVEEKNTTEVLRPTTSPIPGIDWKMTNSEIIDFYMRTENRVKLTPAQLEWVMSIDPEDHGTP